MALKGGYAGIWPQFDGSCGPQPRTRMFGARRPVHLRGRLPHHLPTLRHRGGGGHCAALLGEVHLPHRPPQGSAVPQVSSECWHIWMRWERGKSRVDVFSMDS